MAAMKKHIELLEIKVEDLEKTIGHQKELMTMMKDTMMNQKMILEMIVAKLNTPQETPTLVQVPTLVQTPVPTSVQVPAQESKAQSSVFPMSRRVMV